jgi:putative transposase
MPSHRYKKANQEHAPVATKLARGFAVTKLNKMWVSDASYIWAGRRWAYLAVALDLFARKPIGWAISLVPDSVLTSKALNVVFESRGRPKGVMFHADQDSHYNSWKFR